MVKDIDNRTSELPQALKSTLSFEDTAKQMAALKKMLFNMPDVHPNEEKIRLLKEQIESGIYQVHSKKIAHQLIEHHQITLDQAEFA